MLRRRSAIRPICQLTRRDRIAAEVAVARQAKLNAEATWSKAYDQNQE
jgi:hypothetical protein